MAIFFGRQNLFDFKIFLIAIIAVGILGCNRLDGKVRLTGDRSPDFVKSYILLSGPAIADGSAELLVTLVLLNSDSSPIKSFQPSFAITSGDGVQPSECSVSNKKGISTCILKSIRPGTKRFSVTNLKFPLEKDILFTLAPSKGSLFGLSTSSGLRVQAVSGEELLGTVGNVHSNLIRTGTNGWKLYGGPEGNIVSQ